MTSEIPRLVAARMFGEPARAAAGWAGTARTARGCRGGMLGFPGPRDCSPAGKSPREWEGRAGRIAPGSICFYMFLCVSVCFYTFPVAQCFVLGSNPNSRDVFRSFQVVTGVEREQSILVCSPFLCASHSPQPHPKNSSPTSVTRVQQGGILGERETFWGCDAGHVLRQVGEVPDLVSLC